MKAVRFHAFNGPLQIEDVGEPEAENGDVLVDVEYAAVNPLDIWVMRGTVAGATQPLPFIPGVEASGYLNGKPVLVHGSGVGTTRLGLFAEKMAVPSAAIFPLPEKIDMAQASALGIAGATAWNLVHEIGRTTAGDDALVFGASGGVGTMLIQLLKAAGARVIAHTLSPQKIDFIRSLGADEILTAAPGSLEMRTAPSVVFDPLGGAATARAMQLVKPFGCVVLFGASMAPNAGVDLRGFYRKEAKLLTYSATIRTQEQVRPAIETVTELLAQDKLKVPIDAVLPLKQAQMAFDRIVDRQVCGKIVLSLRS